MAVLKPEVFDLDAHELQEFYKPVPAVPAEKVGRLSSSARLQTIASILAMAVLRRKAGKVLNNNSLPGAKEFSPGGGEGLDLLNEQSVHAGQLVRKSR